MKYMVMLFLAASSTLYGQWEQISFMPFSGTIAGFYMKDSLDITAGFQGDSCYIIKSSDGGRNWAIKNRIPLTDIDLIRFWNDSIIFAAGGYPVVNKLSTDGGASWTNIPFPIFHNYIRDLQFIDRNSAFAVIDLEGGGMNRARLMLTTDLGNSWTALDTIRYELVGLKFINRDTGWVFGRGLYYTTNGGLTFTEVTLPPNFTHPVSLDISSTGSIVIGGYKIAEASPHIYLPVPLIAFSTNNGAIWRVKDFRSDDIWGKADNVQLLGQNTAITTLGESRGVVYTTDYGVNWSRGSGLTRGYEFKDMHIHDGKVFLGGEGAVFMVCENPPAGVWDPRFDGEYQEPSRGVFIKPGYAALASSPGPDRVAKFYYSTDRGLTWKVRSAPWQYLRDLAVDRDSFVLALGADKLYKSDLSGSEFSVLSTVPLSQDLEVLPNGDLWICSGANLLKSSDGGLTWITKFSLTNGNFWGIQMFGDGHGYANSGSLYKTTDHGNTWTQLGFSQYTLSGFSFSDRNKGLIFNTYNVHRTTDGGMSFQPLIFEISNSNFGMVTAFDSLNMFVGGGQLYSTYDGGKQWKVNEFRGLSGRPSGKGYIMMYDHFDGIYFGGTKNIWMTHNRGNTPVELSGFSAVSLGNKVALQWTTETETNNMGFEIERRYKHGDWKTIGFSKGSGTSTKRIFYGFDDHEPKAPAILYYRLKQIDYDGRSTYSNEIEVILGEVPENYSIAQNYPNPFNPSTKVSFTLPEENEVVIRVFNAMGELVKEFNRGILPHGYFDQEIEMADSPSGVYICQVFCTNTVTARTKSMTTKMVLLK